MSKTLSLTIAAAHFNLEGASYTSTRDSKATGQIAPDQESLRESWRHRSFQWWPALEIAGRSLGLSEPLRQCSRRRLCQKFLVSPPRPLPRAYLRLDLPQRSEQVSRAAARWGRAQVPRPRPAPVGAQVPAPRCARCGLQLRPIPDSGRRCSSSGAAELSAFATWGSSCARPCSAARAPPGRRVPGAAGAGGRRGGGPSPADLAGLERERRAIRERLGARRAGPAPCALETPERPVPCLARCDPPRLCAGPGLRFLLAEPGRSPPRKFGKTGETWESRAEKHPDGPRRPLCPQEAADPSIPGLL